MADQGTQAIFVGGTILEVALLAKQRWQMGYKWPIGQTSDNLPDLLFGICGKDAAQGIIGNRMDPLELKKVTVAQKYLDMTQRICDRYQVKYSKPMTEWGTFSAIITQLSQYFECAQLTGTTDPDVMMKASGEAPLRRSWANTHSPVPRLTVRPWSAVLPVPWASYRVIKMFIWANSRFWMPICGMTISTQNKLWIFVITDLVQRAL